MRLCIYDSLLLGAPKAYDGDAGTREPPACRPARVTRAAFLVSANSSERTLLGTEATPARRRVTRWLPVAAAPAFVGVAAAFALTSASGAATPDQATAHRVALSTATGAAAIRTASTPSAASRLTSASRPAAKAASRPVAKPAASTATARKYAVKPGDTLSDIAKRMYHDDRFWTAIYWANHRHLRFANQITVGQVLTVPAKPAKAPAAPKALGAAPVATAVTTGTAQAPVQSYPSQSSTSQSTVSTSGDSSFQACVIQRESGGNSQVMNASGHYGLYQFSASTWAAYGGNPADFGHASVAEQNQVFNNAIAAGGQSNWSLYDGC
jgi:hypothetical protein